MARIEFEVSEEDERVVRKAVAIFQRLDKAISTISGVTVPRVEGTDALGKFITDMCHNYLYDLNDGK